MPSQIACQLYTLRNFTKTPDDLARTLARVKQIGYDAVQVSAIGKMDDQVVADLLKNEGLACCATHVGFERMRDQTEAVIHQHKLWGCRYAAIGGVNYKSVAEWDKFIAQYNAIAKKFIGSGVQLGYHNHSHELVKYEGKNPLDRMLEGFTRDIWMEIDVYWITHGGGDPAAWIEKCRGRVPCVHLKDMTVVNDPAIGKHVQRMAEVGEGNLNMPAIIKAGRAAGTEWYIVEQDDCYGADPFECIATSLKNVKKLGLS